VTADETITRHFIEHASQANLSTRQPSAVTRLRILLSVCAENTGSYPESSVISPLGFPSDQARLHASLQKEYNRSWPLESRSFVTGYHALVSIRVSQRSQRSEPVIQRRGGDSGYVIILPSQSQLSSVCSVRTVTSPSVSTITLQSSYANSTEGACADRRNSVS